MNTGTVKWFDSDKGYGVIAQDDGSEDLFVSRSEIKMIDCISLSEDQKVQFEVGENQNGPCANNVVPITR
ncbi:MAG: cold-shock protein [Sedimentisphaerales bacterium]|nr:cold-shock protein [Sedimentisphaerales bacterium]